MPRFSIVTSAYNEQDGIEKFLVDLFKVKVPGFDVEFVVVDNGSTDSTNSILTDLQKKYKFTLISNPVPTKGISHGYITAIRGGTGDYIAIIRADYQEEPQDIPKLFEELKRQNLECIVGWRKDRNDPLNRKVSSFLYNSLVRLFYNFNIIDINGAPRIFKRKFIDGYDFHSKGIVIDVEVPWLIRRFGGREGYAPAIHYARYTGKSSIKIHTPIRTFFDLMSFTLWTWTAHPTKPKGL